MDKLQEERNLGDELFAEMVTDIKQYIHETYLAKHRVPSADEILSDMDYTGNTLMNFLNGLRPVREYAVHHFTYRLSEMVRAAKFQYEGEEVA